MLQVTVPVPLSYVLAAITLVHLLVLIIVFLSTHQDRSNLVNAVPIEKGIDELFRVSRS